MIIIYLLSFRFISQSNMYLNIDAEEDKKFLGNNRGWINSVEVSKF